MVGEEGRDVNEIILLINLNMSYFISAAQSIFMLSYHSFLSSILAK